MVCPKCANKLKEGATFCNGCGNKIASTGSAIKRLNKTVSSIIVGLLFMSFFGVMMIASAFESWSIGIVGALSVFIAIMLVFLLSAVINGIAELVDDARETKNYNRQLVELFSQQEQTADYSNQYESPQQ
jgi:uncharacterized membrane protein YvbJ